MLGHLCGSNFDYTHWLSVHTYQNDLYQKSYEEILAFCGYIGLVMIVRLHEDD